MNSPPFSCMMTTASVASSGVASTDTTTLPLSSSSSEPLQEPVLVTEGAEKPFQRRRGTLFPARVEMSLALLPLDDFGVVTGGDELIDHVVDRRGATEDGDGGVIEIVYLRDGVVPRMEGSFYPLWYSGKLKDYDG